MLRLPSPRRHHTRPARAMPRVLCVCIGAGMAAGTLLPQNAGDNAAQAPAPLTIDSDARDSRDETPAGSSMRD